MRLRTSLWALALTLGFAPGPRALADAPSLEAKAAELARLRGALNAQNAALEQLRFQEAEALRVLQLRLADLKARRQDETLRIRKLKQEAEAKAEKASSIQAEDDRMKAAVLEAIQKTRAQVAKSLPFHREARLKALSQLENELNTHEKAPADAASVLWRFLRDEDQLASSVRGGDVALSLAPGQPKTLLRGLRIGLSQLFVALPDGGYARVDADEGGVARITSIEDRSAEAEIQRLFDAVDKQIFGGFYRLPLKLQGPRK